MTRSTRIVFIAVAAIGVSSPGFAAILRVASYNITASSGTGVPRTGLNTILQAIGNEVVGGNSLPIDLFGMQEVRDQASTGASVVSLLNTLYPSITYARGSLNGASTGAGTQGVVYNSNKLQLLSEVTIGVTSGSGAPRQTLRYKFRPVGAAASADFYVYNSHWKASDSTADANRRNVEAQAIRADADALGQGTQIIYMGDYNVYRSSDPSFQTMLSAGNGQAFDPINRIGSWNNNASFNDVFTQAPANSPAGGLTGGGLDDRFDWQMMTGEMFDGAGIDYITGTYRAFGNNGSVPLNGDINAPTSTALPGLANRTTVLNLLTTVSDHLPVVADFNYSLTVIPEPTALAFFAAPAFLLLRNRRPTRAA